MQIVSCQLCLVLFTKGTDSREDIFLMFNDRSRFQPNLDKYTSKFENQNKSSHCILVALPPPHAGSLS